MTSTNKANAKWALIRKANRQILAKNRTARNMKLWEQQRMTAEIEYAIERLKTPPFGFVLSET